MRFASPLLRSLACAAALALLAGCDPSSSLVTPPEVEGPQQPVNAVVAGTYKLVSVEGHALPAPYYMDPQYGIESAITTGTMTLAADGTWTRSYTIHYNRDHRDPTPYDVYYSGSGTYTVTGNVVNFSGTEGAHYLAAGSPVPPVGATVDGKAITVHLTATPGARFVRD